MIAATTGPASGDGVLVPFYHYVRASGQFHALDPADFERQLDWLQGTRRIVGYSEFAAALAEHRALDNAALLTFDDGFVEHYDYVFPMLKARRWSGVFFLAGAAFDTPPRVLNVHKTHLLKAALGTDAFAAAVRAQASAQLGAAVAGHRPGLVYRYDAAGDSDVKHLLNYELPFDVADAVLEQLFAAHVGDEPAIARALYLSASAVREMAGDGMVFGFHTEGHRVLSRLSADEQDRELRNGVARIRELTGQTSVPFCYPYGHRHTYDAQTLSLLDRHGYALAFNTTRRLANTMIDDRWEIPRYDTRDLPPFSGSVRA